MKSKCIPRLTEGMRRRPIRPLRLSVSSTSTRMGDSRSFAYVFDDNQFCRQGSANANAHLRFLSSAAASSKATPNPNPTTTTTTTATTFATAMRNMVKPFFLKCHPDVQTSASAKQINLVAIQNLNAFLQAVEASLKPGAKLQRNETTIYDVDFCVVMEERIRGKKEEILCRRTVELTLPIKILQEIQNYDHAKASTTTSTTTNTTSINSKRQQVHGHVEHQLARLLHVAGLQVPKSHQRLVQEEETTLEEQVNQMWTAFLKEGDLTHLDPAKIELARKQKKERNREAFGERIQSQRYHEIYQQTLRDAEANRVTDGLIRNDPQRRTEHLAEILAKVRVQETITTTNHQDGQEGEQQDEGGVVVEVDPLMQLVALRRLSLLLDESFDDLQLEEMGRMWENTTIILTPARSYNTSASALYRRRKRKTKGDVMANDGFKIAIHANDSVTIHIPVDFRDEELKAHLKRHVNDYESMLELGMEDIFPRAVVFDDMDFTIG
jgi:hypothetical protein